MIELVVGPLQRTLLLAGTLLLTGVVTWRGVVVPRARFELSGGDLEPSAELPLITELERRICRLAAGVSIGLVGAWGLRLWGQLMDFRDPFAPLSEDLQFLILDTFWGTVWMGQGAMLLLLGVGFAVLAGRAGRTSPPPPGLTPEGIPRTAPPLLELPLRWRAAAVGVLLLLLSLGLSSHAMSVPANRPLAVAVDVAHAAAAGAWMGSLAIILTATRIHTQRGRLVAAQLRAFSPLAMVSVGVLLFMGILLASFHVHEIAALWESTYGRVLLAKVTVACAVMVAGLWNWRRGLPMIAPPGSEPAADAVRRVRRSATLEVTLAGVVLVLTAILVATPVPPGAH